MGSTSLNDIRTRMQLIAGQVHVIDQILMDKDCPQARWGMIDFCTKSVLQQLDRLAHVLAEGKKEKTDVT